MKAIAAANTAVALAPEAASAALVSGGTAAPDADPAIEPDVEQIARLAYSFWEARGGEGGSPEDDWFRAERELRATKATRL